jgi:ribosomal protein S18 acetylase RimI-like enzyme
MYYCDAFYISTQTYKSISWNNPSTVRPVPVVVPSTSRIKYDTVVVTALSSYVATPIHRQHRKRSVTRLQQQSSSSSTTSTSMVANGSVKINGSSSTWTKSQNTISQPPPPKIPFIIERIPNNPSSALYQEIAQMCITAFFNTDNSKNASQQQQQQRSSASSSSIPIWKEWQLAYLRTLQAGDLERRRKREPMKNRMFLARQVIPLTTSTTTTTTASQSRRIKQQQRPLVLDTSLIRNIDRQPRDIDYMYGDIIGFVEVTQRPYGLGEEGYMVERYVLTNLSVDRIARQSGVGTALVNICEQTIYHEYCRDYNNKNNNHNNNGWKVTDSKNRDDPTKANTNLIVVPDIVLEVEDDNYNAIDFYRKRNYIDVCIDPTSRRYDLSGLWLQQIRCKRLVMKKDLRKSMNSGNNNFINGGGGSNSLVTNMENTMTMGLQALQRFRDNLLNVQ